MIPFSTYCVSLTSAQWAIHRQDSGRVRVCVNGGVCARFCLPQVSVRQLLRACAAQTCSASTAVYTMCYKWAESAPPRKVVSTFLLLCLVPHVTVGMAPLPRMCAPATHFCGRLRVRTLYCQTCQTCEFAHTSQHECLNN
jgi:hypothetical protein